MDKKLCSESNSERQSLVSAARTFFFLSKQRLCSLREASLHWAIHYSNCLFWIESYSR